VSEWQPIETATKDSTRRWLFFPYKHSDDQQCVGWWDDDYGCWIDHRDSNISDPTHWMPLPEPPDGR
jgi:hypothetical protein